MALALGLPLLERDPGPTLEEWEVRVRAELSAMHDLDVSRAGPYTVIDAMAAAPTAFRACLDKSVSGEDPPCELTPSECAQYGASLRRMAEEGWQPAPDLGADRELTETFRAATANVARLRSTDPALASSCLDTLVLLAAPCLASESIFVVGVAAADLTHVLGECREVALRGECRDRREIAPEIVRGAVARATLRLSLEMVERAMLGQFPARPRYSSEVDFRAAVSEVATRDLAFARALNGGPLECPRVPGALADFAVADTHLCGLMEEYSLAWERFQSARAACGSASHQRR